MIHETATVGDGCIVDESAMVGPYAKLGNGCWVGPGSVIMANVELGNGVNVFDSVVVGRDAKIGQGSYIRDDAVIGHGCVIGEGCSITAVLADKVVVGDWMGVYGHESCPIMHDITPGYRPAIGRALVKVLRARAAGNCSPVNGATEFDISDWRCGTTACVAGHLNLSNYTSFAEYLGIALSDAERICMPSNYDYDMREDSHLVALEAASRLEAALNVAAAARETGDDADADLASAELPASL